MRTALSLSLIPLIGCGDVAVDSVVVGLDVPCDYQLHTHRFESDVSASGYTVYAQVKQARVYLHEDLLAAADLDDLLCDGGEGQESWLADCAAGVTDPDMYHGTHITLIRDDVSGDAARPDYLLWTFGDGDGVLVNTPTSAEDEEGFFFRLAWSSLSGEAITGTTSADVQLLYGGFDDDCDSEVDSADQDCWIVVEDPAAPGVEEAHWGLESEAVETTSSVNLGDCQ